VIAQKVESTFEGRIDYIGLLRVQL
jgi:hypothetical protein